MPRNSRVSGFEVDVPVPRMVQVRAVDICHALSNIQRFGGWLDRPFTVAQHSVEVAWLCRANALEFGVDPDEAELMGALHDGHEAYIGDVITPVKRRMGTEYAELERAVDDAIHAAFGATRMRERCRELVQFADREMLVSDAVRWGVNATVVDAHGCAHVIRDGKPPPGYQVRYRGHAVWPRWVARRKLMRCIRRALRNLAIVSRPLRAMGDLERDAREIIATREWLSERPS